MATALTCHSYYSLLRAPRSPAALVEHAAAGGYAAVALADVNALYGVVEFMAAAEAAGLAGICGAELLTGNHQVAALVENERGYRNLCQILTRRHLIEDFDLATAVAEGEGLIFVGQDRRTLRMLQRHVPRANLFALCTTKAQADWAQAAGIEPVAGNPWAIVTAEDELTQRLQAKVRAISNDGPGLADRCPPGKLTPAPVMAARWAKHPAWANAQEIAVRCRFDPRQQPLHLPQVKLPAGEKAATHLARRCHLGLARRYGRITEAMIRRLEKELRVIADNGFSDYFLLVHEIVQFAQSQGIPVEVRGSAAGALVTYLLGMTRVCPLEHDLYFERFMNPGRKDCPDIDIDLCWRRRDEVVRFCYKHWGADHVAMVAAINRYRRRSALRDTARAFDLAPGQVAALMKPDAASKPTNIHRLANRLLEMPRHIGLHCGGIVITPGPVAQLAPLQMATKGVVVTQYDKDAAAAVGLVKIDLLGNRALSTAAEAVRFVTGRPALDIDAIAKDDAPTAALLTAGDSLGVFQAESPGMRQMLRALRIRHRGDLAIALSLIRPGPANGGMKAEFIARHVQGRPFTYLHPRLATLLADTYGLMLYQEDVMRMAVEIAGYSLAEANQFRTEVSDKVSTARLQEQYREFVYHRAPAAGIDRDAAEAIWDHVLRFAAYSFCKAHATVYANIAWQTAYLKAHHPREFYTALFRNHQGMYPLRVYVWDALRRGIRVRGPHVNDSEAEWSLQGGIIRAGLGLIKGLPNAPIAAIREARQKGRFRDLADLRARVRLGYPDLQRLIHVGACDGLGPSRPMMLWQARYDAQALRQPLLFDAYGTAAAAKTPDYDRLARLRAEVALTEIPFSLHPALLIEGDYVPALRLAEHVDREVAVAGFVAAARTARTQAGKLMGFATVEDFSGLTEVSFFPEKLDAYRRIAHTGGPVWAAGRVTQHLASLTVEARRAGRLELAG